MFARLLPVCVAVLLAAGISSARREDEDKSDGDIKVKEGTEFELRKDKITLEKEPAENQPASATIKPGEAQTVKMPAQKWKLGLTASPKKGGGVVVGSADEDGPLMRMRTRPGQAKEEVEAPWHVDPGDMITHVDGYQVKTIQELICAVNAAKDKTDLQIILKDVNTKNVQVFYVTAAKR